MPEHVTLREVPPEEQTTLEQLARSERPRPAWSSVQILLGLRDGESPSALAWRLGVTGTGTAIPSSGDGGAATGRGGHGRSPPSRVSSDLPDEPLSFAGVMLPGALVGVIVSLVLHGIGWRVAFPAPSTVLREQL